jgi:hypothetical protein
MSGPRDHVVKPPPPPPVVVKPPPPPPVVVKPPPPWEPVARNRDVNAIAHRQLNGEPMGKRVGEVGKNIEAQGFDRKPAFAENIKTDLRTAATSLSVYERALEGFVLRRHPGEVEGLTKHGEKVVKELAELQTSIEKGPNKTFSLERTQAAR